MKNNVNLLILALIVILIQVSFINNGILFSFYPNLVLVFTIYVGQKKGRILGGLFGLITGLLMDVLLSPNLGIKALNLLLVGYNIGIMSEYIFEENYKTGVLYVISGTLMYTLINNIIYFFLSYKVSFTAFFAELFRIESILNLIIFLLIQKIRVENIKSFKLPKLKGN